MGAPTPCKPRCLPLPARSRRRAPMLLATALGPTDGVWLIGQPRSFHRAGRQLQFLRSWSRTTGSGALSPARDTSPTHGTNTPAARDWRQALRGHWHVQLALGPRNRRGASDPNLASRTRAHSAVRMALEGTRGTRDGAKALVRASRFWGQRLREHSGSRARDHF